MKNYNDIDDTIAAISTPSGTGGIGIVRLSGADAISIADRLFVSKNKSRPSEFVSHTFRYGWVVRGSQEECLSADAALDVIDEALLSVMRAPKSYTREDVVEISSHGGSVVVRQILERAIELGARLAEPGEFTKRAFLHGRIDLTQAEAVGDIIRCKTDAFLRVSTHQLKGELTESLEAIREELTGVFSALEAAINFPEEDVDEQAYSVLIGQTNTALNKIQKLLQTSEYGKVLREGIHIVICGKTNVGKSSLLNVLLKQPRAIVSDIAGTTRDTIEESANIRGILITLVDTAGVLEPRDFIETEALRRSHMHMKSADLVLFMVDASEPLSQEDYGIYEHIKDQNILLVVNKNDLPSAVTVDQLDSAFPSLPRVTVSAVEKQGISSLEEQVVSLALGGEPVSEDAVMVSNARHIDALKKSAAEVQEAHSLLSGHSALEVISEQLKEAIRDLDTITGRDINADVLDRIFSEFCIGK